MPGNVFPSASHSRSFALKAVCFASGCRRRGASTGWGPRVPALGPGARHGTHTGHMRGHLRSSGGAGHRGQAWTRTSGNPQLPGEQKGPSPRGLRTSVGGARSGALGHRRSCRRPAGSLHCLDGAVPTAPVSQGQPAACTSHPESGPLPCPSASVCPMDDCALCSPRPPLT